MEIQRYAVNHMRGVLGPALQPHPHGGYVLYTDLLWYRRQYHFTGALLVIVCAVFSAYLVWDARGPKTVPVEKVAIEQRHSEDELARLQADLEQKEDALAEVKKLHRDIDKVSGKLDGALKLNANLKAQIQELNKRRNPTEQTEVLRAAAKMPDRDVLALAQELGFTKVRVGE